MVQLRAHNISQQLFSINSVVTMQYSPGCTQQASSVMNSVMALLNTDVMDM